jgi:hypothetical protein
MSLVVLLCTRGEHSCDCVCSVYTGVMTMTGTVTMTGVTGECCCAPRLVAGCSCFCSQVWQLLS